MQKPPYPRGDDRPDPDRSAGQDNPFGRSFHRSGVREPAFGEPPRSSIAELDQRIADDDLYEKMPAGFGDLARRVAETNQLVDRAISSMSAESTQPFSAESLEELGENLNLLFSQLYDAAGEGNTSPWHTITDSLRDLSAKIERREELRAELQLTQHSIDKAKLRLIDQIQGVAKQEQERLSVTRMRSRLATVMADKLLNKLR